MTDHNREEREALIEKAAKAIRADLNRQHEERHDGPYVASEDPDRGVIVDGVVNFVEAARAALAVFEQAHTPASDEREPRWSHPDAVYSPEVFMAMQELLNDAKGSPTHALRIAVSRAQAEPTAAEGTGQPTNHEIRAHERGER